MQSNKKLRKYQASLFLYEKTDNWTLGFRAKSNRKILINLKLIAQKF